MKYLDVSQLTLCSSLRVSYKVLRDIGLVLLCCTLSHGSIFAQEDNSDLGKQTSFSSLKLLCEALTVGNEQLLKKLATEEGYDILINDRGLESLFVDALFWQAAISEGKVYISDIIDTEKEFETFITGKEHETLFIASYSDNELMLIEKITFIQEDNVWKFHHFEDS